VISVGALTPILVCFHKLEITPPSNFNQSCDGTVWRSSKGQNIRKTAQQSGFPYVAQDNFFDPIGQLAETRRQMCKINWLTR
jgi:hypothetical protein